MDKDFEIPRNWSAMLTSKNADKIAERILEILDNTTYSVVVVNEFYRFEPEIKVNQKLHREDNHPNPVTVQRFSDNHTGITISDSYGLYPISSFIESDRYDCDVKQQAYIRFAYKEVIIKQRTPAGHIIMWLFKAE